MRVLRVSYDPIVISKATEFMRYIYSGQCRTVSRVYTFGLGFFGQRGKCKGVLECFKRVLHHAELISGRPMFRGSKGLGLNVWHCD